MEHNQDHLTVPKFDKNGLIIINLNQVNDSKRNRKIVCVAFEVIDGELPPPGLPCLIPVGTLPY